MEQKKTLWIIAAVGAFLLVVLGTAGLFYYSPAKRTVPTIASVSPVEKKTTNTGWTTPAIEPKSSDSTTQLIELPSEVVAKTNDVVVLADNATTIDLNSLKQEIISETTPAQSQPQNINITVNIPETKETNYISAPVLESPKETSKASSVTVKKADTAKKEASKVPADSTTSVTTKAVVKATENTTVTTTVTKTEIKKTQFWVQVAAYSNKKGAEGARSILDANKIPADIFTYKDNKDNLFYRVRVGPYTTKSEAEYWRSRIIKIDEFSKAESYVTSTTN